MLLSCVDLRYSDLPRGLIDVPPRDLEIARYQELQYLRILDSQSRLTVAGKQICGNWHDIEMLTPFCASLLFSWPRSVSKPYVVWICLIISSFSNHRDDFTNFNKRVEQAFCPMFDTVTLLNLLLLAVITRDYRGLCPESCDTFRREIDVIARIMNITNDLTFFGDMKPGTII
jgi:hypothetical protein